MTPPLQRVLYVCHDGDLFGSQQSLALMVAHAHEMGVSPVVSIARPGPLNARLAEIPGVTLTAHRRLAWLKHDRRTGLQRAGDIAGLLASAGPRAQRLAGIIRQHRIALVHTNSLASLEGALAATLAGVPHLWHVRELFASDNPKLRPTLGSALTRHVVQALSTRIICISQAVAAQFPAARGQLVVIPNAVAMPAPDVVPPKPLVSRTPETLRVGYVGRLSAGKRFLDLLEALALLGDGPPVELLVAGKFVDAPYERLIHERIAVLGLAGRVRLLGVLTDLAPFYASLDVLVLPSKDEPFGRVLIEAMAAGVPCIGADSGGIPEIIEPGVSGFLYPCGDVPALTACLRACTDTRPSLETLGHNARRAVAQRFTIAAQMQALGACYDAVTPYPAP